MEYRDYVVKGCDGRLRYKERPYQIGIDELMEERPRSWREVAREKYDEWKKRKQESAGI